MQRDGLQSSSELKDATSSSYCFFFLSIVPFLFFIQCDGGWGGGRTMQSIPYKARATWHE